MQTRVPGAFLYSLESELSAPPDIAEIAILVNGLFSRQICLTESQMFDCAGVEVFFKKHERLLEQMVASPRPNELPLLATCGRTGADVQAAIDLWLEPKGGEGLPQYLSKLSPEQNDALREGFRSLRSKGQRRKRFLKICGAKYYDHLKRVEKYLNGDHTRTVVRPASRPVGSLYDATRQVLRSFDGPEFKNLKKMDKEIIDTLAKAMDSLPSGETPTRERLHRAIYCGDLPPVYAGEVRWERSKIDRSVVRDEWRFIVNTIYNRNLASRYDLRPVLNTAWWRVGNRFFGGRSPRILGIENTGSLTIAAPILEIG